MPDYSKTTNGRTQAYAAGNNISAMLQGQRGGGNRGTINKSYFGDETPVLDRDMESTYNAQQTAEAGGSTGPSNRSASYAGLEPSAEYSPQIADFALQLDNMYTALFQNVGRQNEDYGFRQYDINTGYDRQVRDERAGRGSSNINTGGIAKAQEGRAGDDYVRASEGAQKDFNRSIRDIENDYKRGTSDLTGRMMRAYRGVSRETIERAIERAFAASQADAYGESISRTEGIIASLQGGV